MISNKNANTEGQVLKFSPTYLALLSVSTVLLIIAFYSGLEEMVDVWNRKEEYGYGYLIPVLTIFFIWQKKDELEKMPFSGSWIGVGVMLAGVFTLVMGELSTLYIIVQYSFLLTLYGAVLSITGWKVFKKILVPLLFLVFMIPLPQFLYQGLSAQLQLISSELGVAFIRLFDISVYLEGNIIDLGIYKLQVVEACSGLRYLFPLASLSFVAAYIFKAEFWKRAVIFISSVPITIVMNSFRIGVIGILVDNWGIEQAEGFLHYFEGWVIFMFCMGILFLEIYILTIIGNKKRTLSDVFTLDIPGPKNDNAITSQRKITIPSIAASVILISALIVSAVLSEKEEIHPERATFASFPLQFKDWVGKASALEQIYLDVLKLDDYIKVNYENDRGELVNFYVAYYASQKKGESAHSPRSCIPGGGWQIKEIKRKEINSVDINGMPLTVNRLIIRKGDYRQLVYYWFQGRNRIITNEYMVKWFLFWDALTKNRTDGSLVRLTTLIEPNDDIKDADERLARFAGDVSGFLTDYIPN